MVELKSTGYMQRINEFLLCYLPLHYPLLFTYVEDGCYTEIPRTTYSKRPNLTLGEFLAFRIQHREGEIHQLILGRRLFQQFIVDSYMMMESQTLQWIRHNEPKLRYESYKKVANKVDNLKQILHHVVVSSYCHHLI